MIEQHDYACYVLVRNDLPSLNPGKAMAQVLHAGHQMMYHLSEHPLVKNYLKQGIEGSADGFNTAIVLAASKNQILSTMRLAHVAGSDIILCRKVYDPTYPFVVDLEIADLINNVNGVTVVTETGVSGMFLCTREELTCAWFLIDRNNEKARALFNDLPLY